MGTFHFLTPCWEGGGDQIKNFKRHPPSYDASLKRAKKYKTCKKPQVSIYHRSVKDWTFSTLLGGHYEMVIVRDLRFLPKVLDLYALSNDVS